MIDERANILFDGLDDKDQCLCRFFLLLRLLQQSNQFVFKHPATGLTVMESSLLLEIDGRTPITTQTLANLFEVKQSTMTRNLDKLTSKGLIRRTTSSIDSRSKTISVTPKGKEILKKHDKLANEIIEKYEKRVSKKWLLKLSDVFNKAADGFKILPPAVRQGEHPVRSAMRRLSFLLGITRSAGFMGSTLSALNWQILSEIFLRGEIQSIKEFSHTISIPQANIIQLISRLEQSGLIIKQISRDDQRKTSFACSDKGIIAIKKIISSAVNKLKTLCSHQTQEEIQDILPHLELMVGKTPFGDMLISNKLSIVSMHGVRQLNQARRFIFQFASSKPNLTLEQHEFASPSNKVFGILRDTTLRGIIEISKNHRKQKIIFDFLEQDVTKDKKAIIEYISKI